MQMRDAELLNAINTCSPDATRFLTVKAICNTVIPIKRLFLINYWSTFHSERCRQCYDILLMSSGGSICAEWVDICCVFIDPYAYERIDMRCVSRETGRDGPNMLQFSKGYRERSL